MGAFAALTANGSSNETKLGAGRHTIFLDDVFDGATVDIETSRVGQDDWASVHTATAPGRFNLETGACEMRATMSGAGASSNVIVGWEIY